MVQLRFAFVEQKRALSSTRTERSSSLVNKGEGLPLSAVTTVLAALTRVALLLIVRCASAGSAEEPALIPAVHPLVVHISFLNWSPRQPSGMA